VSINTSFFSGKKTKLVFWVVSDCDTINKREDYVKALQKYIQVDVFGACTGQAFCNSTTNKYKQDKLPSIQCFSQHHKIYKFYLAFENSNCKEYITEKFHRPMSDGSIGIYQYAQSAQATICSVITQPLSTL
jgi:hypothetical protein